MVNCLKLGGMERVAVNLSDAFAKSEHDVTLIYLKNRKPEILPRNKEVKVELFDIKKSALLSVVGVFWLLICKILNMVFRKTFPNFFAVLECYFFKIKLNQYEKKNGRFDLIVFRGQGTFDHMWPLHDDRFVFVCENIQSPMKYGVISGPIYRGIFNNRRVVCVSDGALKSFHEMCNLHGVRVKSSIKISNPNDYQAMRDDANEIERSDCHDKPYILGLGRLEPVKNFQLLVRAYAILKRKYQIAEDLVIVGSGSDEKNTKELVQELNLESCVAFKGRSLNPFPWYKNAELFVLSSSFEGLGMVLIESLACGTPVVATDSKGGVREVMADAFDENLAKETPEDLADKILSVLRKGRSDEFYNNAAIVLKRFEDEKIVSEYLNEFKAI